MRQSWTRCSKGFWEGKKTLVAGIQGSGKTYLVKAISRKFLSMVYTPHLEEWKEERVVAVKMRDFVGEFPAWVEFFKLSKFELLVADEADLLFKGWWDVSPGVRDLVVNHRHYGKTLCFVTRRPQDIPAQLYGQFEILCLFSIESPQVKELLNRYYEGLGELVAKLPYGSHYFILKHIGHPPALVRVGE